MYTRIQCRKIGLVLFTILSLFIVPAANADDADDVMAFVNQWAALEHDLEAQAELIRSDRVQVAGGVRQSDQAGNLAVQLANHKARSRIAGGEPEMIVRIESPLVRIYGNTAVVSFVRLFNVIPHNQPPIPGNANWFTLVLVKDGGDWGIAHSHVSATGN